MIADLTTISVGLLVAGLVVLALVVAAELSGRRRGGAQTRALAGVETTARAKQRLRRLSWATGIVAAALTLVTAVFLARPWAPAGGSSGTQPSAATDSQPQTGAGTDTLQAPAQAPQSAQQGSSGFGSGGS